MDNVVWLRPPDDEPRGKACLVHSGDEWWQGTVIWEATRREDGLWWGEVTYRKDGEVITEARSQHDLRAR